MVWSSMSRVASLHYFPLIMTKELETLMSRKTVSGSSWQIWCFYIYFTFRGIVFSILTVVNLPLAAEICHKYTLINLTFSTIHSLIHTYIIFKFIPAVFYWSIFPYSIITINIYPLLALYVLQWMYILYEWIYIGACSCIYTYEPYVTSNIFLHVCQKMYLCLKPTSQCLWVMFLINI